ncbi:MAG: hypothetical protein Q4P09_08650 [Phascolarctobacterium sp.]|nr:hypothetical protein [Phascolarctobacterium sp.]
MDERARLKEMREQARNAVRSHKLEKSPLYIACHSCGAPAEFDIIHQSYHCQHCGAHTDVDTTLEFVKKWRGEQRHKLKQAVTQQDLQAESVSCANCGAEVVLPAGEITAKCDFCGGKLVRKEFNQQEYFPEIIIPFYITPQEARSQLDKWLAANKDTKEAQIISQHCKQLAAYYLPYQVVQGSVDCEIFRDGSTKKYRCAGYVENVAVNASKQMDNSVLNAMEPFDWTKAVPFEYGFIAGQRAKMQDLGPKALEQRTLEEIHEAYLPTIEKTLQTDGLDVHSYLRQDSWSLSALLPAYVWQGQGLKLAINGQTGRVAVKVKQQIKTRPWYIEPALYTALGTAAFYALLLGFGVQEAEVLAGILGVFLAIVFCSIFGNSTRQRLKNKYLQSEAVKAERAQGDKLVLQKVEAVETLAPQFVEKIKGQEQFVKLSFYSSARLTKQMALFAGLNLLPVALAWLFGAVLDAKVEYSTISAWWCISVPVTLVWLVKFSRLTIFDFPIMQIIQPNGSLSEVISAPFEKEVAQLIGMGFKWLWRGMLAFAIIIAFMAVA